MVIFSRVSLLIYVRCSSIHCVESNIVNGERMEVNISDRTDDCLMRLKISQLDEEPMVIDPCEIAKMFVVYTVERYIWLKEML